MCVLIINSVLSWLPACMQPVVYRAYVGMKLTAHLNSSRTTITSAMKQNNRGGKTHGNSFIIKFLIGVMRIIYGVITISCTINDNDLWLNMIKDKLVSSRVT